MIGISKGSDSLLRLLGAQFFTSGASLMVFAKRK